jgi:hypothetical protein
MSNGKKVVIDPVVAQLETIKRLLVLQLMREGATQGDVAIALRIDRADVSRMMPTTKLSSSKAKK